MTNTESEINMDYFEAILQDYLESYPSKEKLKRKYDYSKFRDYRKMALKNKESGVVSRIEGSNMGKNNITFDDIKYDMFTVEEFECERFLGSCNKMPNSAEKETLMHDENCDDIRFSYIFDDECYWAYAITKTYRLWFKIYNSSDFFIIDVDDEDLSPLKLNGRMKDYKLKNIYKALSFLPEKRVDDIIKEVIRNENYFNNILDNHTRVLTKKELQIMAVIDNAKREKHKRDQNFSYTRTRVKQALKKIQENPEEDEFFSNKKDIIGKDYSRWRI